MNNIIIILLSLLIVGCSNSRYHNWEHVRIEHSIPSKSCEYKIQEACSNSEAWCYKWYKKRATTFGANTVVLTKTSKDLAVSSNPFIKKGSGGYTKLTALADYYHCPKK